MRQRPATLRHRPRTRDARRSPRLPTIPSRPSVASCAAQLTNVRKTEKNGE